MCTRLTRPIFASLAALALCACGGGEGEPATTSQQDEAPSAPVFGGDRTAQADEPAEAEQTEAATAQESAPALPEMPTSDVPFRDDTPEAALTTYMDRLAAGDLLGAVEICDPNAPGTEALQKKAVNTRNAAAESGMSLSMLVGLLTEGVGEATREEASRTEERVAYMVTVPDKRPREIVVIRTPDGWRVQPPESGLPNA